MAQYGHNWYGTAYYGKTNAFSGWYETREIFTDEPLKATMNLRARATLPSAKYAAVSPEAQQVAGTWTEDVTFEKLYSSSPNAELHLKATCENLVIHYEQRTVGAKVDLEVTTIEMGGNTSVKTYVLNTQAATVNANATYTVPATPFGAQTVKIKMAVDSPAGANFNFKGFGGRTADLTFESRARQLSTSPGLYDKLETTVTHVSGDLYDITATSPGYSGTDHVQMKIYLASSDNETTPEIDFVELSAGDTSRRTEDGQWSAVFNMEQIAIAAGKSFAEVEEVTWTETVPASTELNIRSQSGPTNTVGTWSVEKKTVPYRQNVNRLRLKEGFTKGWVDTPVNAPAWRPHVSNTQWDKWEDQSYLPPDSGGTSVVYDFLSAQKDNAVNPYIQIENPMNHALRNLRGTRLKNFDNVIRVRLSRSAGKQTPVVDFITLDSFLHYEQDVVTTNQEFSAVDFDNTGEGVVLELSGIAPYFEIPAETSAPTYRLIDATERPQDVTLYLDSEKREAIRTNTTLDTMNKVWAKAKKRAPGTTNGLSVHYQYGGGQVSFPLVDEIQMAPTFTPQLNNGIRYRYYLESGWPTQTYTVQNGQSLEDIFSITGVPVAELEVENPNIRRSNDGSLISGQLLQLPNATVNSDVHMYWKTTNSQRTSKSTHNAAIDGTINIESDSVMAEVSEASTYGWVDWVSEEKIYDGVVNLNDVRGNYKRTHLSPDSQNSAQVEYLAVAGDTYRSIANRFGVYEEDVRRLNQVTVADAQPTAGDRVLVPSRVVLPSLHPRAVVQENPYHIDIVYNSVKKQDGVVLPTSAIDVSPLAISYKTVQRTGMEVVRGAIENGKDLLPEARIVSIQRVDQGVVQFLGGVEYVLTGNQVDWNGSGSEPAAGSTYTVDYTVEVPETVTVTLDTNYREEGGVDRIWRSPEVKEFTGMCAPGTDHAMELPVFAEWRGLPDNNVEDLQYIVEDNDLWVKTWVEQRNGKWFVVGSLQDRIPKQNWFPTIQTGYYYLGKDEYYLYSEPTTIEPGERDMPLAENVSFVEGKFQNAVNVQEGSQNLVRNSGFEGTTSKGTSFKLTF